MAASSSSTATRTHDTVDAVASKAHEALETAEQKVQQGIESGRATAEQVIENAKVYEAQARETIDDTTEQVTRYIQEKPLQAAGIAFAAGVLATLLLRRP